MKKWSLYFTAPYTAEVSAKPMPEPADDELLVATHMSAISAGTEMLVFKGLFPDDLPLDESIPSIAGRFRYPLKYGYSCVGRVIAAGPQADPQWVGRQVFAFHPHESHFVSRPAALRPLPEDVSPDDALFLASMETAVNLVMDGRPLIGEQAVIWGLGVIGLLTAALLAQHPLGSLIGVDRLGMRRQAARKWGVERVFSGTETEFCSMMSSALANDQGEGKADLLYELSGNPEALKGLLPWAGFDGRIVIGSWYGTKKAPIPLGGRFHRDRIRIISSQVSTIHPRLTGRWSKSRRLAAAWRMLKRCQPARLITHRFDLNDAHRAYELIANKPDLALQVVLTYSSG
jgi:threonine dehydrogenase-like Zn-dependent dehydrogenase